MTENEEEEREKKKRIHMTENEEGNKKSPLYKQK